MNILLIGNGGREHALAWKLKQSPRCEKLFVAPGNAGTATVAENIAIGATDFEGLGNFCLKENISLVVVGPEAPLVNGLIDYFKSNPTLKAIHLVGPDRSGARLEGSKDFSKQFMIRHGIPTAKANTFSQNELAEAIKCIDTCKPPIVLKADGLAGGKGVIISLSKTEAKAVIKEMLVDHKFGAASSKVLIEEFLNGIEVSVFVLTDGNDYVVLPEAKDYKRIGDGDTGPNTGGMGAVSPVSFATPDFMKKVEAKVIKPTIAGLKKEGIDYRGFIFIGLMNVGGEPFVIEYNVRMGDPETEAVMPRIKSDLVDLMEATATGKLKDFTLEIDSDYAVTVVMVSGGYPNDFEKDKVITGLDKTSAAHVFQAGTRREAGQILTDGGRVLAITGKGATLEAARQSAYERVTSLTWDNHGYRKDIGLDLISLKGK